MERNRNTDMYTVWVDLKLVEEPVDKYVIKVMREILFNLTYDMRDINSVVVRIKYVRVDHKSSYSNDILGIYTHPGWEPMSYKHIMKSAARIITGKMDISEAVLNFINK